MDSNLMRHPSPTKKMKCSFLDYIQLLMIGRAGQWIHTPSTTRLQPEKWNAYFWITFNFWWSARLVNGLKPHPPALSGQKKWNAHFWITFTFWWSAELVDGLKPHLPPLSRHKIKCSFLYYVQLVLIGRAGQWTQTLSATPLQPKNEVLIFGLWSISDNSLGWSMDSNPICHLSPAKNEMLVFGLCSASDNWLGWSMDSNPSATPLQQKKWNACFWIMFNFWWLARLVDGLKPHLLPLSNQKNDMLIFGLRSTSYDWPGWSMDSNPICNPSPTKKMKWSFLDYVQLLMIGQAGWKAPTPSATSFQPKNEMLIFVLRYSSDDQPCWSMDSKPIHHPSSQKNEMLIFVLRSTSDNRRGWLMDSNCIHYPSPAKKMKCSFLYYIQLLMIGRAGHWTWTPSPSCLKPKKMKCSFLDYV